MQHSVMPLILLYNLFYAILNADGVQQSTSAATDQRQAPAHIVLWSFELYVTESLSLTATVRRDGLRHVSKDNRWGTFPSVALAWRISQEKFLKPLPRLG